MDRVVDQLLREAASDPRVLGLAGGLPHPSQFPRGALGRSFLSAVQDPAALQYGWPEGGPRLREWIASRLRERGAAVCADDVLVTNGAQQAMAVAVQLLTRQGAPVAADDATYPGALDLLRARQREPTAGVLGPRNPPVAYVMPQVGNPLGVAMSVADRARLLKSRTRIIEDDAYADLRFDGRPGRPLLAEARDRVWHVGTLSKSLCPGLRIGWLVPPSNRLARARAALQADALQPSSLSQAVVEDYLAHVDFDARLSRLRRFYRRRARRLAQALSRELPGWRFRAPEGGFAIWAHPDGEAGEEDFLRRAVAQGVSFDPGSLFRPDASAQPLALRLCFSNVDTDADLDEATRRLARAWRACTRVPRKR